MSGSAHEEAGRLVDALDGPREKGARGTGAHRLRREVVPVVALAEKRHEEVARTGLARVDDGAAEAPLRISRPVCERLAERGGDERRVESGPSRRHGEATSSLLDGTRR